MTILAPVIDKPPQLLRAAPVVEQLTEKLHSEFNQLASEGVVPRLDVVRVGEDEASKLYVQKKKKKCEELGGICVIHALREGISSEEFLRVIGDIQKKPDVHGLLLQLPLPREFSALEVYRLVAPEKDVDGLHPDNFYRVASGREAFKAFVPCTPKGIVKLLDFYSFSLEGKHVVVVGRSMIVGKPLGLLCLERGASVSFCHSQTNNLQDHMKRADILVVAVGRGEFFDESFLGEGQVVIDVGINRNSLGKIVGDIKSQALQKKAKAFTPVPGGVGPMTVISLMENLLTAARRQSGNE